ncbi:MAG: hypothetical protein WAK55_28215 [Xanthobacteraceae bacterium]
MTRAGFAVAVIALVSTVALATEEYLTSAQAQTHTAPPESTIWDHNASVMYLVAIGSTRELYYQKPRPGMSEAGARPGSLLFHGQINNGQYFGTAYIFNRYCGPIPFQVKGPILDNDERIVLTGEAPRVGRNCRAYESYASTLEFRRLKSNEVAKSQAPNVAMPAPESKSLPSAPTALPSVTNEALSAPKDQSRVAGEPKMVAELKVVSSTPATQPSVTNEDPSEARDLDSNIWEAVLIVMGVSLFGFLPAKTLSRRRK